jgi:hypothetical protein
MQQFLNEYTYVLCRNTEVDFVWSGLEETMLMSWENVKRTAEERVRNPCFSQEVLESLLCSLFCAIPGWYSCYTRSMHMLYPDDTCGISGGTDVLYPDDTRAMIWQCVLVGCRSVIFGLLHTWLLLRGLQPATEWAVFFLEAGAGMLIPGANADKVLAS